MNDDIETADRFALGCDGFGCFGCSDVQLQSVTTNLLGNLVQVVGHGRDVQHGYGRAVTGQHFGDGSTNTTRAASNQGFLAGQRLVPIEFFGVETSFRNTYYLGRDVSGFGRQEEVQRRGQLRLCTFIHIDQLCGCAFLDFLAHRAGETFQSTLGHAGGAGLGFRGAANDHNSGTLFQLADHRVEELPQGFQLVRVLNTGGIKDQTFELGIVIAVGSVVVCINAQLAGFLLQLGSIAVVGQHGNLGFRCPFQGAENAVDSGRTVGGTYQYTALDEGGLARLPTIENDRNGEVDCAKQRLAHGGIGNRLIGIAHDPVLCHQR